MSEGFALHDFSELVGNDAHAVAACAASLRAEGWALVRFPPVLTKDAEEVARQLDAFFARDEPSKRAFNISNLLGYNAGGERAMSSLFSLTRRSARSCA
jgi:hypothetical protein